MDLWSPEFIGATWRKGGEVVVFDNRGIGETDNPTGRTRSPKSPTTPPGSSTALGNDSMDVMGWSMGGHGAIDLTVRYPDVVERLVSYAGSPAARDAIPLSRRRWPS